MLRSGGSILVLYMAWLPFEDKIAGASEKHVLKYNPEWSGAGETKHQIDIPDCYKENFELVYHEEFTLRIPFTREKLEWKNEGLPWNRRFTYRERNFNVGTRAWDAPWTNCAE